jgi:hypothetical protein
MKNGFILIGIIFAVALAIVVGSRLSNEAMAVAVGAVCGISACIPMSLGLAIAASRNWGRNDAPREIEYDRGHLGDYSSRRYASPQPPVVVISPPQHAEGAGMYPYANAPRYAYFPPMSNEAGIRPREFKIVGEE